MPILSRISGAHGFGFGGVDYRFSDPLRNQTVLHLATLGSKRVDSNNLFVDNSSYKYSFIRTGNVAPSTFSPYGNSWSNYFDGSGDYLAGPTNNASFDFGTADFTVETWFYLNASSDMTIASLSIPGGVVAESSNAWYFESYPSATGVRFVLSSGSTQYAVSSSALQIGRWYHLAATRSSGTLRLFVDGVLQSSTSANVTVNTPAGRRLSIGYYSLNATRYVNGNISNLRVVKGTALYTTDFTPSKTPLTVVSGTSLLTCASNRFIDLSSNNFFLTTNGNVAVKSASPFMKQKSFEPQVKGWSVAFNGTNQYLQTPAATSGNGLQLGTSHFTIECWVKAKPQASLSRVIDSGAFSNPNYGFSLSSRISADDTGLEFAMYTGNNSDYVSVLLPNVLNNTWKHVAITRIGNTLYGYVDGVLTQSTAIGVNTRDLNYITPITIGVYKSPTTITYSNYFSGKISNVRIIKAAIYNGNFKPEGSPLSVYPGRGGVNASLLCCQSSDPYRDASYSFFTLTNNNISVSDFDNPFYQDDEMSYYFDGNGDYVSIGDNLALEIGSADFTIEAWVNMRTAAKAEANSDLNYYSVIAGKNNSYFMGLAGNISGRTGIWFQIYDGSSFYNYTGSFSFSPSAWYHIAASRQSGTLRLFVNGLLVNTTAGVTYTAANNASSFTVASISGGTNYSFDGYISNLRLVTGSALYTSGFTPVIAPIPIASTGATGLITCRGRTLLNDADTALTLTTFGSASPTSNPTSRISPFRKDDLYGTSYYFNNADTLNVSHPGAIITPLQIGTGNFTIEFWFYANNDANGVNLEYFVDFRPSGGTTNVAPSIYRSTAGAIIFQTGSTSRISSTPIPARAWTHVAVVKISTTTRLYINGQQVGTSYADSNSYIVGSGRPILGSSGNTAANYILDGYISGFSFQKSIGKYTAAFTPPTSPELLVDYSTSLLPDAQPAVYDSMRRNSIETIGGTSIGATITKGQTVNVPYFDGNANYLAIPNSLDFDLGTGDFAIETWVYISGNSAADASGGKTAAIISCYASSTQGWMLNIGGNATTTGIGLWLETHNAGTYANTVTPTISISQATWHHIAVTRSSGTVRFFLNGTQQGSNSTFNTSLSSGGAQAWIGGTNLAGYPRYLNGYLHDLRVTKGAARYTENFTIPKGLLPTK